MKDKKTLSITDNLVYTGWKWARSLLFPYLELNTSDYVPFHWEWVDTPPLAARLC